MRSVPGSEKLDQRFGFDRVQRKENGHVLRRNEAQVVCGAHSDRRPQDSGAR